MAAALQGDEGQIFGLGYILALLGFLLGIGAFRFWLTWAAGREIDPAEEHAAHGRAGDWLRYFRSRSPHPHTAIPTATPLKPPTRRQ